MKKVRKTITLSPKVVKTLELLSRTYGKSQSLVIEELIEKEFEELRFKKRKEAVQWIKTNRESFRGLFGDRTFQNLKAERGSEL